MVTHPSINRARRWLTSLIRPTSLTITLCRQPTKPAVSQLSTARWTCGYVMLFVLFFAVQVSQEMMRFDQPSPSPRRAAAAAVPTSTGRKVVGIVICKHCHAKNDRSPSDYEVSQDVSQSEDEKVTLLRAKCWLSSRLCSASSINSSASLLHYTQYSL